MGRLLVVSITESSHDYTKILMTIRENGYFTFVRKPSLGNRSLSLK